jgi:hypothetical protein
MNILLPIFDMYPMLSNKKFDYIRFKELLLSGVNMSVNLPSYTPEELAQPFYLV